MGTITRLPSRPLRGPDIAELTDGGLRAVPYGGVPGEEEVRIYAIKVAAGETAHALGFDDEREQWNRLLSVDAGDLAAADRQLDTVLDEWVQEQYGDEFEVLKQLQF
ncbi:MAG: hypothetical protein ABEJ06_00725 [Haloarculaceae archaeon]